MSATPLFEARINGQPVPIRPGETLLAGALRAGVDFPHSCRVGGCGSCRCRVLEGRVHQRTDPAYLLTDDEYRQNFVLACQSEARSDLVVAVPQGVRTDARRVTGRVVGQTRVAPEIVELTVQLDEALAWRAGQHAQLALPARDPNSGTGLLRRSYSMAHPSDGTGRAVFYVRRVAGGAFSGRVFDDTLIGQPVTLDGPAGDFWLRRSGAPLLMVAAGSGLAPLLAMLRQAAEEGVSRAVTVLFGARREEDLFVRAELDALGRDWAGLFRFVPVLSQPGPGWHGACGRVTDHLPALLEPGAHAYLCGPPAMVDAVATRLADLGLPKEHTFTDRFAGQDDNLFAAIETAAPAAVAASRPSRPLTTAVASTRPPAGVADYLKFASFHLIGLAAAASLAAGGPWPVLGFVAINLFYVAGDASLGDDTRTPRFRHPDVLTALLWAALPLLTLIVFVAVWRVSPGDPLGFGAWVAGWSGRDVLAARDAAGWPTHLATVLQTGLLIGMIGTIPAHELTHRTWDRVSLAVGRWLLAFSFDTSFAIEHVYGHHRAVATADDPATAPRGRSVYRHIWASTWRGNRSAWRIETARLRRLGLPVWSPRNALLRGTAMSGLLLAAAAALGGAAGLVILVAAGLWGKALLEIVNYMEHYGLVRVPGTPVQPRHSWNTNRRLSSWSLFNLTRHSHHHAEGEVPFQDLQPIPQAPQMIGGYLTTIGVALCPPLWHRLMTPRVLAWDRDFASPAERALAREANARSGLAALQGATTA